MLIGHLRPGSVRRLGAPLSLALGLPLLLGSTPAAAAVSVGALGGFTTGIGVLAALWAMLAPRQGADATGTTWMAVAAGAVVVSGFWGWRHQRARVGHALRKSPAGVSPWGAAPRVSAAAQLPVRWPAGLDAQEVLTAARSRFIRLQEAWDDADVQALAGLTTPDMLAQLLPVLNVRGEGPNRTDVITLNAELLVVEEVGAVVLATVEFSGLIRESAEAGPVPFRELWLLSSARETSPAWRLARQQTLF